MKILMAWYCEMVSDYSIRSPVLFVDIVSLTTSFKDFLSGKGNTWTPSILSEDFTEFSEGFLSYYRKFWEKNVISQVQNLQT